jgi:hypothetical protein
MGKADEANLAATGDAFLSAVSGLYRGLKKLPRRAPPEARHAVQMGRPGLVFAFVATPKMWTIETIPVDQVLAYVTSPEFEEPPIALNPLSTDPLEIAVTRGNLLDCFAAMGVKGVLEEGAKPEDLRNAWVLAAGLAVRTEEGMWRRINAALLRQRPEIPH